MSLLVCDNLGAILLLLQRSMRSVPPHFLLYFQIMLAYYSLNLYTIVRVGHHENMQSRIIDVDVQSNSTVKNEF